MSTPTTSAKITEHGIVWPRRAMDVRKDIRPLAQEVGGMEHKSAWGVTDLAVWWSDFAKDANGERLPLEVLASWLRIAVETLYDRITVGRAWPIADRDAESDYLTYSHYRALSSLANREQRLHWLARAAQERIPVNQLRSILKGEANLNGELARTAQSVRITQANANRPTAPAPTAPAPNRNVDEPINETLDRTAAPVGMALAHTPIGGGITTNSTQNGQRRIVLSDAICKRIYARCGDNYEAAVQLAEELITAGLDAQAPSQRVQQLQQSAGAGRFGKIEVTPAA